MDLLGWYLLIGVVAGMIAGLLGVGGGIVLVPALMMLFKSVGVDPTYITHLAVGTSLATISLTALSSIHTHHLASSVEWPIVKRLTIGLIFGAVAGAFLADQFSAVGLQRLFGCFAILMALKMMLQLQPKTVRSLPGRKGLLVAGSVIGSLSALLGIGGGTVTVPFLNSCQVPIKRAIGSSAACGLPIALFGAAGFIVIGREATHLPSGATGYVFWPAVFSIAITSLLFAAVGAKLAHRLPSMRLKQIFGLLLSVVGLKLIVTTV